MNTLKYMLRFVGVVIISSVIYCGLYLLATWVCASAMTIIPLLIKSLFDFSVPDVTNSLLLSHIAGISPRWAAAICSNSFPVRMALLLNIFGVIIAFALIVYVTSWLVRIINGSKFLTIVSSLPLLLTIINLYFAFYCNSTITDKGFWFYCLTITIGLIVLVYIGSTIYISWTYKD